MKLKVERTGKQFSIASSEFLITFPDGTTETIWSPVWNEYTEEQLDKAAKFRAEWLWNERKPYKFHVCRECEIPHFDNCTACFGFGTYKSKKGTGEIVPVTAGEAYEIVIKGLIHELGMLLTCPVCGSTINGIPEWIEEE
jgi:hypothetical protein